MAKYKKCSRCDLNWIPTEEDLCEVCKAELGKASSIILLEDDDDEIEYEERICPVCKLNYLADDEDICPACKLEQTTKKIEKPDEEEDWEQFVDEEADAVAEDDGEISLSALEEEEDIDDDIEEKEVDDFDESLDDLDDIDLDDEDEDEDDDE